MKKLIPVNDKYSRDEMYNKINLLSFVIKYRYKK